MMAAPQAQPESPAAGGAAPPSLPWLKMFALGLVLAWLSLIFWNSAKPLPGGTHVASPTSRLSEADVEFLFDPPQQQDSPQQQDLPQQQNLPQRREAAAIEHAEQLIVIDRSPVARELEQRVLARKRARPNIKVVLVTDPGNEAFGGTHAQTLTALEAAGVIVARVRLERLRDSNPLYSGLWRLAFAWWSDPFEEEPGRAGVQAWARMQNFKSDQRQLLVTDDGSGGWTAIVAPGGPGEGLVLRGPLARAIIASELQVAKWSTDDDRLPARPPLDGGGVGSIDARFLTEGAIETALLDALAAAGSGDQVSIEVRHFSERKLIAAALAAASRGAMLRVLLSRTPIPNQAVAGELLRGAGGRIEVRWSGHAAAAAQPSLLLLRHRTDLWVDWGTASFTRRNLGDLNLEAGVELRMPLRAAPARAVTEHFARVWADASGADAANAPAGYWQYWLAEATGLSSF